MKRAVFALSLACAAPLAMADGLTALDHFLKNVHSGQAQFTQTVTAPERDGEPGRVSVSSGTFVFGRPGKFRFDYQQPFPQLIVGDGQTLWVYDEDLNQATSRDQDQALNSTPAAILTSATSRSALEQSFTLQSVPAAQGLEWVVATPKDDDGALRSVRMGFDGDVLAALEIEDNFAQHSALRFENFQANVSVAPERFVFTPPADADVIHETP